jgi:crotonobetainyl-CoA:carnitine CoA-transferase CaiB-like acyl-CoA transferase
LRNAPTSLGVARAPLSELDNVEFLRSPHKKTRFVAEELENRGIEEHNRIDHTTMKGIIMTSNTLDTPKVVAVFDINAQFRSVMHDLGLSPEDTGGEITFVGEDPIFPTVHRLGACISIPIMAGAAAVANIWRQRTGRGQDLTLDLRKAIHGINPMYKFTPTINGFPYQLPYWINPSYQIDKPMGFDLYRTKDGRLFLPTGAYPGLLNNMCSFLRRGPNKDQIAEAVSKWDSEELDAAAAEAGARVRHRPHSRGVGGTPAGSAAGRQAVGGDHQDRRQRSRAVHPGRTSALGAAGAGRHPRDRRQCHGPHAGRARGRGATDRPPRGV